MKEFRERYARARLFQCQTFRHRQIGVGMPSREAALENLLKAKANWRPPRQWRSYAEQRVIRRLTWQWATAEGKRCSVRAFARWLGVSHVWVLKLLREFSVRPEREEPGYVTLEDLARAREQTRRQLSYLRSPSAAQLKALDSRVALPPTTRDDQQRCSRFLTPPSMPDYNAIHMRHLVAEARHAPRRIGLLRGRRPSRWYR